MADLSVIVCTHQRPDDLERCLGALERLEDPVEVVVVDSASEPPCRVLVDRFRGRIGHLSYIRELRPGLSVARNAGVAASTGTLIAFIDDDTVPAPNWARAVITAFAGDPRIACLGGTCLPAFDGSRPRWLSDRLLQLAGITRLGKRAREPNGSAEWPFGANMAFRREALEAAGPFSAALGRQGGRLLSGEDSDMVARIVAAGGRVWLEPSAIVAHRVTAERCTSRYYWRRLWWNGVGRAVNPSCGLTLRLLAAIPLRALLWLVVRDRVYLYRLAESGGYLAARLGLAGSAAAA
jgi:GT2 family glycosyltransferase